jgi:hypothetical protein
VSELSLFYRRFVVTQEIRSLCLARHARLQTRCKTREPSLARSGDCCTLVEGPFVPLRRTLRGGAGSAPHAAETCHVERPRPVSPGLLQGQRVGGLLLPLSSHKRENFVSGQQNQPVKAAHSLRGLRGQAWLADTVLGTSYCTGACQQVLMVRVHQALYMF